MRGTIQLSALDRHFAGFIVDLEERAGRVFHRDGAERDRLWLAAALASAAGGRGHSCLDLASTEGTAVAGQVPQEALPVPDSDEWRAILEGCATIGRPGDFTPLVLDRAGRLYLHRAWEWERQVADAVARLGADDSAGEPPAAVLLDRYFPPKGEEPDLQRLAAETALTRRFTVISGGPGTGKTATVARILAMAHTMFTPPPRIALAAPTGKAAMRLRQSIEQAFSRLPEGAMPAEGLPREVRTIHRLLGVIPGSVSFRHDRNNPLPYDMLVVDEASMVDLPLMARLLDAVPPGARVILLGDRDQLASVEAGAVLADICASGSAAGAAGPAVVQLRRSWRFGPQSGIGRLSRLVNAGDGEGALDLLRSGECPDITWRDIPSGREFDGAFDAAAGEGFSAYTSCSGPREALVQLDRFRVLTPLREGPYGTLALNRICSSALGRRRAKAVSAVCFEPLMVSGNDYGLGLFNGDTCVTEAADERQSAWFDDGAGGVRRLSRLRLPPADPAYALTVHKSQGSEFERVLLVLPECGHELIGRELLYTAITRARERVELWSSAEVFLQAVGRRIERNSGLRDMIREGGAS